MKKLNIILLLCASVTTILANRQMLTTEETAMKARLESLCWRGALSDTDIGLVKSGISSPKDEVSGAALVVALVHEVENLKGLLQGRVGPSNGWSRKLATVFLIKTNESKNVHAILSSILPSNKDPIGLEDTVTDVQLATRAIVIRQARDLRNGVRVTPETNGLQLTDFDAELLRYSQTPKSQAVSNIIERVRSAEIATTKMYALTEVLSSYGNDGLNAALSEMADPRQITKYGKVILLNYLGSQSLLMSDSDKGKLRSVILIIDRSDRDLASACENVEYRLAIPSQKTE